MFEFARPASARAASRKRPEHHTLNPSQAKISVAVRSHIPRKGMARTAMLLPVAAMALAMGTGCKQKSQPSPDVWAVVNGQEIKRDDVDKYYRTRVNPEGQEPSQEEALSLKLNVLDELINNEILLERAKKLNLEASDGEVEDKFTEMKSPYTEDEFQRQLKDRGVSVDDLKRDLRRQLSITKLLNREVVAKISITDQDVTDTYNANKGQFNVVEPRYRISEIVVTPRKEPQIRNLKNDDATNEVEAERKVKMLEDKLNSGADFAQLAMDYSEDMNSSAMGGDLGYVPESALNQSDATLKRIVMGMKPGQVSPPLPIQSKEGPRIVILKLISRESPGQRNINDPQVQQTIRDTLRNHKEQLLRAAYLTIARDDARVTNYLAQQVIEAAGKLPDAAKTDFPAKSSGH
ncbi:MAG TPA: SurA N-terminal domain-containing protein [Candidatus Acidoferrum sp.]|jgi:peptidyl-prolyl cis-trans isomerase SurA|nr:SurA N-terminal domain-containing protein [Candidatus Acidoferrum sp.]